MKATILITSVLSLLLMNGCKKPKDVHCDMATLNIYNNSKTQAVVFHWNTAQNWDTIMPGETTSATMENLKMEYAIDGSITSKSTEIVYFETNSATYAYEFSLCDETINAPGGFVDLSEDCANGEYNPESGELDVDCGGFCVPCSEPQFTCTTPADEVNWDIFGLPDATVTSTNINYAFGVSITFNFSNARLVAIIHSPTLPTETKRFDIGALDNQMQIYYHVGFASYSPDPNQHVYIVKDANGDFYLKYCDLQFSEGNISFLGSANIPLIK